MSPIRSVRMLRSSVRMFRCSMRVRPFPVFVNSLGRPDDMRIGGSDDIRVLAGIGNGVQDMLDRVETRAILVVGAHDRPRRIRGVGVKKHGFLGFGIGLPPAQGFHIHRAELPLLEGILRPAEKPPQLLLAADGKPEFIESNPAAHHHPLKFRRLAHEFQIFVRGAKSHHMFDARAIVPGAVEEDDFTFGGKLFDVTLEIPLAPLRVRGFGESHDSWRRED